MCWSIASDVDYHYDITQTYFISSLVISFLTNIYILSFDTLIHKALKLSKRLWKTSTNLTKTILFPNPHLLNLRLAYSIQFLILPMYYITSQSKEIIFKDTFTEYMAWRNQFMVHLLIIIFNEFIKMSTNKTMKSSKPLLKQIPTRFKSFPNLLRHNRSLHHSIAFQRKFWKKWIMKVVIEILHSFLVAGAYLTATNITKDTPCSIM